MAYPKQNWTQVNPSALQYAVDTDENVCTAELPIVSHAEDLVKQARDLSAYAHNLVEALQGIGSLNSGKSVPERSGLGGQLSEVQIAIHNAFQSMRELRTYLIGGE